MPILATLPPLRSLSCDSTMSLAGSSLLFPLEVEEEKKKTEVVPTKDVTYLKALKDRLSLFASPSSGFSLKLLRDVRSFKRNVLFEEGKMDMILLATKLSLVGYRVNVRNALGGGAACFKQLRHEFLTIAGESDQDGIELIVEVNFREQFTISQPTIEYAELLEVVPEIFVGPSARLVPIVQVLGAEMEDSFEAQGLTFPPWRKTQSLLSKWLPPRSKDTSFSKSSDESVSPSDAPASPSGYSTESSFTTPASSNSMTSDTSRYGGIDAVDIANCDPQYFAKPPGASPKSLLSVKLQGLTGYRPLQNPYRQNLIGRVPSNWGEPAIHKVKLGFAV